MTGEQADFRPPSPAKEIALLSRFSKVKKADSFPTLKYRWNNNQEVLSFLISFDNHDQWRTSSTQKRPPNGSMLLYDRKKTKDYRKDGYLWKKRKTGNTAREDHFKLKVHKIECVNAMYTHSALVPTFHRRCYWLLENPDIILVHYLNFVEECTSPQTVTVQAHSSKISTEDISHQLETIYSGVDAEIKPDIQVTELTDSSCSSESNCETNDEPKGKGSSGCKAFSISITPPADMKQKEKTFRSTPTGNGTDGVSNNNNNDFGDDFLRVVSLPAQLPSLDLPSDVSASPQAQPITSPGINTCHHPIGGSSLSSSQGQPMSSSRIYTCHHPIGQRQPLGISATSFPGLNAASQHTQLVTASNSYTCNVIGASLSTSQQTVPIRTTDISATTAGHFPPMSGPPVGSQFQAFPPVHSEMVTTNSPVMTFQRIPRASFTATKPVTIAPKPRPQEPNESRVNVHPTRVNALNGLNPNAAPTGSICSSPSSDYGSSSENPREGVFDGPFRVPHPIPHEQDKQSPLLPRVSFIRRNSVAESSGSSASSSSHSSFQETAAQPIQASTTAPSLPTSSTDSDAGIDLTDLQDFPPFQLDVLNSDLCLNLPADAFPGSFSVEEALKDNFQGNARGFSEIDQSFLEDNGSIPRSDDNFMENSRNFAEINTNFVENGCEGSVHSSSTLPVSAYAATLITTQSNACSAASSVAPSAAPIFFPTSSNASFPAMTSFGHVADGLTPPTAVSHGTVDINMVDVNSVSQPSISGGNVPLPIDLRTTAQPVAASGRLQDNGSPLVSKPPGHVVPVSARIIEYSPEWSYPEGGTKVLVTGEWSVTQGTFTCLFDGCSVQATLIHSGVLRCFCPAHHPGLVTLQVACNGFIVSNACVFEYRTRDSPSGAVYHEWLAKDDTRFKLAVLDRLERLESRLYSATLGTVDLGEVQQSVELEDRLVRICATLFSAVRVDDANTRDRDKPYRGLTLLHLSAALGYSVLVVGLLRCRRETDSEAIRDELDPLRKDDFSSTPLMWACALGHTETVGVLLAHEPSALLLADARGRLPLQIARDRGFGGVVERIEEFILASPQRQTLLFGNLAEEPKTPGGAWESFSETGSPMTVPPFSAPPSNGPKEPMSVGSPASECSSADSGSVPSSMCQANTLGKALTQVRSMINQAEQEAEMEQGAGAGWGPRVRAQLSSLHENSELVTSPGSWKASARICSFSSASTQASPLTSGSSLSPGSPGFLSSPHSSTSGAPDTAEFEEFIMSSRRLLEKDFSDLTLTDREQQELYEAAKIIQNAYRNYKVRRHQHEQEIQAAILIQHQYRRYKQFVVTKKKTQAARIIQNQYRAHREHERFQRSRQAASIIQNHFRIYRERCRSQRRREESKHKRQEARFIRQFSNRSKDSPLNTHLQVSE